ncbi:MAG: calcium-binding protein, partial [Xenococcaceae cyanobacterium]
DFYIVDTISDVITENAQNTDKNIEDIEDSDTVISSVDYSLVANSNLENLVLTGNNAINATGNEFANVIKGNSANNNLNGGEGHDALDGGDGIDNLAGGNGDDVYIVDTTTDTITENDNEGMDTVASSATYTLATSPNLENITLTGNAPINATGNYVHNQLEGNSGNNILNGGGGRDYLVGGEGVDTLIGGVDDDFYIVDNINDLIIEKINEGIDFVTSVVSYTLSDNTENLGLEERGNIRGIGNSLNNNIVGNRGNNILDGKAGDDTINSNSGNDTIAGGKGGDRFIYKNDDTDRALDLDTITDFTSGIDRIVLSKNIFTALKSLAGDDFSERSEFAVVADDRAVATSKAFIVYSVASKHLFYNQNGSSPGLGSGKQFVILNGVTSLSAKDFIIEK